MRILFLTIAKIKSLEERGIYADLLRKFRNEGHEIFSVSPVERRDRKPTHLIKEKGVNLLQVRTFNLQKTNVIEKGIGTLVIEYQYLRAIKNQFPSKKFDLILYSTPPITFSKVIRYIKKRDQAYSYLLLKDIFPQNAVDMHLMKDGGILHKLFIKKERILYEMSDTIGCMSLANRNYLLAHHSNLTPGKVEVNPNSIEPLDHEVLASDKLAIRKKYGLPVQAKTFVYGGNLGVPQGIDFLLETIDKCINKDVFFLIVGTGTEYNKVRQWFVEKEPKNALLIAWLPKEDYDYLLNTCDVGMIFLNPNFTIPNFPCRLLPYLEYKIPVLAATDKVSDIGQVIERYGCGKWVHSGDINGMLSTIDAMIEDPQHFQVMKQKTRKLLEEEFTVEVSYKLIMEKVDIIV